MAELNAEAEALKQRHALQKKDIKLQEEKLKLAMELEEVKLKAEIAKAREKVLAEVEAEYEEGTLSILSELTEEMPKSTPKTMEYILKSKSSYGKSDKDLVGQNPVQYRVKRKILRHAKLMIKKKQDFYCKKRNLKFSKTKSNYRRTCYPAEKSNFTTV